MSNATNMQIVQIVGFDLGHGETAVSICPVGDGAQAQDMDVWGNGMKSVTTAIGWLPNKEIRVGEKALTNLKVNEKCICFKGDPLGRPGESKPEAEKRNCVVQAYSKAWCDQLLKNNQVSGDGTTRYYVGCPSGWSPESIRCYHDLLAKVSSSSLEIIKESRAGFVNAVDSKAGILALNALRENILIVDIGSSTTDLTLVHNLLDEDFGNPQLGAALIEQALFDHTLKQLPDRARWDAAFDKYPHLRARCEIACRKTKKIYFQGEQDYLDDPTQSAVQNEMVVGLGTFAPTAYAATMESILDEGQPALSGRSWRAAFRDTLLDARKKLVDLLADQSIVTLIGSDSTLRRRTYSRSSP